jgi:hypothetical protein
MRWKDSKKFRSMTTASSESIDTQGIWTVHVSLTHV